MLRTMPLKSTPKMVPATTCLYILNMLKVNEIYIDILDMKWIISLTYPPDTCYFKTIWVKKRLSYSLRISGNWYLTTWYLIPPEREFSCEFGLGFLLKLYMGEISLSVVLCTNHNKNDSSWWHRPQVQTVHLTKWKQSSDKVISRQWTRQAM